jgi:hypothetical protein
LKDRLKWASAHGLLLFLEAGAANSPSDIRSPTYRVVPGA